MSTVISGGLLASLVGFRYSISRGRSWSPRILTFRSRAICAGAQTLSGVLAVEQVIQRQAHFVGTARRLDLEVPGVSSGELPSQNTATPSGWL
jgi:hypothetical protein